MLFLFYFSLIKNVLVKQFFSFYCLKLGLLMFLEYFLAFAKFQPLIACRYVSYKKNTCNVKTI